MAPGKKTAHPPGSGLFFSSSVLMGNTAINSKATILRSHLASLSDSPGSTRKGSLGTFAEAHEVSISRLRSFRDGDDKALSTGAAWKPVIFTSSTAPSGIFCPPALRLRSRSDSNALICYYAASFSRRNAANRLGSYATRTLSHQRNTHIVTNTTAGRKLEEKFDATAVNQHKTMYAQFAVCSGLDA